ncbi:NAD-dependent epimerase/dehydratase family protein [bacterium]|nr:NAD-dependent epimerase/dehydratase family protein [bacterium]
MDRETITRAGNASLKHSALTTNELIRGTEIQVMKILNTYLLNDDSLVTNVVIQTLRGKILTICGDCSQTRSFCYVDDLSEGMVPINDESDITGPMNLDKKMNSTSANLPNIFAINRIDICLLRITHFQKMIHTIPTLYQSRYKSKTWNPT